MQTASVDENRRKPETSSKASPKVTSRASKAARGERELAQDLPGRASIADYQESDADSRSRRTVSNVDRQQVSRDAGNGEIIAPYVKKQTPTGELENSRHDAEIARIDRVRAKTLTPSVDRPAATSNRSTETTRGATSARDAQTEPGDPFASLVDQQLDDIQSAIAEGNRRETAKPAAPQARTAATASTPSARVASTDALAGMPAIAPQAAVRPAQVADPVIHPSPAIGRLRVNREQEPAPPTSRSSSAIPAAERMIVDSNKARSRFMGDASPRLSAAIAGSASQRSDCRIEATAQASKCGKDEHSGVVNAVGRRLEDGRFEDTAFEGRTACANSPVGLDAARLASRSADLPEPAGLDGAETPDKPIVAAPENPRNADRVASHDDKPVASQAWFAIGMAVGLGSSIGLWLRKRRSTSTVAS